MCTDYRVTDSRSGRLIDDATVKFLQVHFPPLEGGPIVLFSYTGLAILPDGSRTGVWLRETLRGDVETFDDSMRYLGERLNRDIAPVHAPLVINALVLHGDRRYCGGLSNVCGDGRLHDSFVYGLEELDKPAWFANGSGTRVIAMQHKELINGQLEVRPRRVMDHLKLLATVNRRIAASERTVSPQCHVSFISGDDRAGPISHVFSEKDEHVPFEMPILLFGIDLSRMAVEGFERFGAERSGTESAFGGFRDAFNEGVRRRR